MPALTALASEHGVSNRAVFLGQVPHERLATYYRAADFTILYSGYEGMSHVLLESLGLGTPVIASDKGGNREVVQHGVNGLLAPYPDPAALVETIRAAFEPRTHGTLNAHARSGLDRFDWTQTVQQTITILEQVAGG
jgi:D-inositol-3-phosphate glycosyltransferase